MFPEGLSKLVVELEVVAAILFGVGVVWLWRAAQGFRRRKK